MKHNQSVSSVAQSCPTLCDPTDCSTPGFPVHTNSQSLLKLMSIELVMPSNHLILCHLLLLPPSIFPSIRVFSTSVHEVQNNGMDLKHLYSRKVFFFFFSRGGGSGKVQGGGCFNIKQKSKTQNRSLRTEIVKRAIKRKNGEKSTSPLK